MKPKATDGHEKRSEAEILAVLERYRRDPIAYFRECLQIADKTGKLVPFELNYTQRVIIEEIRKARVAGRPPRLIVLKSRQVGVSTLTEALLYRAAHLYANRSALVLAHNEKSSKALFRMTRRFDKYLPPDLRHRKKLDNVREIQFDNDSILTVETAGEVRGYTSQDVHLSEFAFYENDTTTLRAVLQGVPRIPQSLVLIESTANGVGNKFHELWMRAIGKTKERTSDAIEGSGWVPIFIPWFKHTEYRMPQWFSSFDLSVAEEELVKAHGLDLAQLAWRRWCIDTNCDGDEELFHQEYPSTWEEAFLLTGRPAFSPEQIRFHQRLVPPEVEASTLPPRCEIEWSPEERKPVLTPNREGRLRVYADFNPRHSYVVGVDPSEGDRGSDPSPIRVFDRMTLDFVAVWNGREPPDVLAGYARLLALAYGEALIINEANNHGIMFHNTLLFSLNYGRIFYRQTSVDSIAGEVTQKPGFLTGERNRHVLVNILRRYIRLKVKDFPEAESHRILDPEFIGEMPTFVYDDKGRARAQPGFHDDHTIAAALCLFAHAGDEKSPLLPLPEQEVASHAMELLLMRDRDPEAAERQAQGLFGLTADEVVRVYDARARRDLEQEATGIGGER